MDLPDHGHGAGLFVGDAPLFRILWRRRGVHGWEVDPAGFTSLPAACERAEALLGWDYMAPPIVQTIVLRPEADYSYELPLVVD